MHCLQQQLASGACSSAYMQLGGWCRLTCGHCPQAAAAAAEAPPAGRGGHAA